MKNEQNMQIHLIGGIAVIGAAWYFSVDHVEWLLLVLVIGGVLTVETINTAIERTVDLVTEEYHPLAERAKDISAAGVFVFLFVCCCYRFVDFYALYYRFVSVKEVEKCRLTSLLKKQSKPDRRHIRLTQTFKLVLHCC
ncbi:diacylglycerol kinase family protein [Bacillus sp. JCM 19041]|uniref:diacylglycerol kinase family protein n=1 Tax=Bacillus sp. JCM 19041 TaxID=1460637 RepID=UPI00336A2D98